MNGLDEGEAKTNRAVKTATLFEHSVDMERADGIEQEKDVVESTFQAFVEELKETQTKLQNVARQWQDFDTLGSSIGDMLKKTESQLKRENALTDSLASKEQQVVNIKASFTCLLCFASCQIDWLTLDCVRSACTHVMNMASIDTQQFLFVY